MKAWRLLFAFGVAIALALSVVLVPAAVAQASSLCGNPLSGQYRIQNDASLHYLTSEGYKAQMKTTGSASTFNVYQCSSTGVYQFEVAGSNSLCMEYSGNFSAGVVIADTCTSTRLSQQWVATLPGNNELISNGYGSEAMYTPGVSDGSLVDAAYASKPNAHWKIYKH